MTLAICAVIAVCIVAGLERIARRTGAGHREVEESLNEFYEQFYPQPFYETRKWEVKTD